MLKKKLLIATLVVMPALESAYAQKCVTPNPLQKSLSETVDSMYFPVDLIQSCGTQEHKSKAASWREGVPNQINQFFSGNLMPIVKTGLDDMNISDNISPVAIPELEATFKEGRGLTPQKKNQITTNFQRSYEKSILEKLRSPANQARLLTATQNKVCSSGVKFQLKPQEGILTVDSEMGSGISPSQARAKAVSEMLESIKEYETTSSSTVTVCSDPLLMYSELEPVDNFSTYDIPKELFFKDNQATLEPSKLKGVMNGITKELKTGTPNCLKRIKSIQIQSSANQVANTENYSRWDFQKLSADRARFIEKELRLHLQSMESKGVIQGASAPSAINALGDNGNGTSGPCPYEVVPSSDGRFKIQRAPDVKQSELENAKFVRVNLETEEFGSGCNAAQRAQSSPPHSYSASKCYDIRISCNP